MKPDALPAYRLTLEREVPAHLGQLQKTILFVMLNPSTADDRVDDPTIRRCADFALRLNAARFVVVNLFTLRATKPAELVRRCREGVDIGWHARESLDKQVLWAHTVVVAFGEPPAYLRRKAEIFVSFMRRHWPGQRWKCLGTTKSGAPRHPLYVRATARLENWDAEAWLSARGEAVRA